MNGDLRIPMALAHQIADRVATIDGPVSRDQAAGLRALAKTLSFACRHDATIRPVAIEALEALFAWLDFAAGGVTPIRPSVAVNRRDELLAKVEALRAAIDRTGG